MHVTTASPRAGSRRVGRGGAAGAGCAVSGVESGCGASSYVRPNGAQLKLMGRDDGERTPALREVGANQHFVDPIAAPAERSTKCCL
jgi:hypothetical protein